MKKFFSFAIALVACALAFTSCEPKVNSPIVGSWNARGYLILDGTTYNCLRTFSFFDNGTFEYGEYILEDDYAVHDGFVTTGKFKLDGDKVTLSKQKYAKSHNGNRTYYNDYVPSEELAKWRIEDHYLYLNRYLGTEDEHEERYYDGSAPN